MIFLPVLDKNILDCSSGGEKFYVYVGAKPAFYWWIKKKYNGGNREKNKKGWIKQKAIKHLGHQVDWSVASLVGTPHITLCCADWENETHNNSYQWRNYQKAFCMANHHIGDIWCNTPSLCKMFEIYSKSKIGKRRQRAT